MIFLFHIVAAILIGCFVGKLFGELKALRSSQKDIHYKLNVIRILIQAGQPVEPADSIAIMFVEEDGTLTEVGDPMNLKKEKLREFVLVAKTAKGKVTRVDGEPAIVLPDGVSISEIDGKKYLGVSDDLAEGPLDSLITVDADGDLGDGVKPLHFEAAVNVVAADAATLEIQLGEEIDAP